jgi:hypothetical protein
VLSSLRKRSPDLADIIGGVTPAITVIRMVPGRHRWPHIIAAIEFG